jgi:hypothetical protein
MPGKGWFSILRLYSPLEPFFAKTWRPSEIELVAATVGSGAIERIEQRIDRIEQKIDRR